jgi:hypothetical protein
MIGLIMNEESRMKTQETRKEQETGNKKASSCKCSRMGWIVMMVMICFKGGRGEK